MQELQQQRRPREPPVAGPGSRDETERQEREEDRAEHIEEEIELGDHAGAVVLDEAGGRAADHVEQAVPVRREAADVGPLRVQAEVIALVATLPLSCQWPVCWCWKTAYGASTTP